MNMWYLIGGIVALVVSAYGWLVSAADARQTKEQVGVLKKNSDDLMDRYKNQRAQLLDLESRFVAMENRFNRPAPKTEPVMTNAPLKPYRAPRKKIDK